MITGTQIKSARKLLGWSLTTLAKRSGQSVLAISTIEDSVDPALVPPENTVKRIRAALEEAGIQFVSENGEATVLFRL